MTTTIHDLRKRAADLEADGGDKDGAYIGLLYQAARELEEAQRREQEWREVGLLIRQRDQWKKAALDLAESCELVRHGTPGMGEAIALIERLSKP